MRYDILVIGFTKKKQKNKKTKTKTKQKRTATQFCAKLALKLM